MDTGPDGRDANLLGALALVLADRMRQAVVDAAGATSAGPAALAFLDGFGDGRSIDQLRAVVGLSSSGAVRLVDRLQGEGLVERRAGVDARSVALHLTSRGRAVAAAIRHARAHAVGRALEGLSRDERAALTPLLERLLREITVQRMRDRGVGQVPPDGWLCRLCDPSACGREVGRCPVVDAAAGAS